MTPIRPQVYLGSRAPNFTASSSQGPIEFYTYAANSWCLFFSHPAPFTPICTTELGALAALEPEFNARNCKLLGLSTSSPNDHTQWLQDIAHVTGYHVHFPLLSDQSRRVASTYGMIDLRHFDLQGRPIPIRAAYLVDPRREVRLVHAYPISTGRNTAELLRALDALQAADAFSHQLVTPVNWVPGDDAVVAPEVSEDTAARRFPNYRTLTPYLRLTPVDPDEL